MDKRCVALRQRCTSPSAFSICATRSALTAFACKHCTLKPRLGYPWAPLEHLPAVASSAVLRRGWLHAVRSLPAACCMLCYMLHGPIAVRCRLHVVGCRASTAQLSVACSGCMLQLEPAAAVSVFPCGHRSLIGMGCCSDAVRRCGPVAVFSAFRRSRSSAQTIAIASPQCAARHSAAQRSAVQRSTD
jgi:hypothetical protein